MRGFVSALPFALTLASVASVALPPQKGRGQKFEDAGTVQDRVSVDIAVSISSGRSPDDQQRRTLTFEMGVLKSEDACGYGNVTIHHQLLPQALNGDVSEGRGSLTTVQKEIAVSSWSFHCIKVNGTPDSQLMKLVVNSVDGEAVENVGFSVLFKQNSLVQILNVETDTSIPVKVVDSSNPEKLEFPDKKRPESGEEVFSLHQEIDDLDYLYYQMRNLKCLIREKERSIRYHSHHHHHSEILHNCDSLKCVLRALTDEARHAAHAMYGTLSNEGKELGHKHHQRPHVHKFNHKSRDRKESLTHPVPPRDLPLPICKYPPPNRHHEHQLGRGRTSSHMLRPDIDQSRFEDKKSPHKKFENSGERFNMATPPAFTHHRGPMHDQEPPPHPPPFHHPGPYHHRPPVRILQVAKFFFAGFILAFLLITLNRRICTPVRRAEKHARREKRHRRDAYRRIIHKNLITHILSKIPGNNGEATDSDEYGEKHDGLTARGEEGEDGLSTHITSEILNVTNTMPYVVDPSTAPVPVMTPILAPSMDMDSETRPLMHNFELSSQLGEGEELPAYEDNDSSEMSSVVADGFTYTPESRRDSSDGYAPLVGSVDDFWGSSTKN